MTAAKLKASLLDQAIRGQLVAQDPNDEPAAILLARIRGGCGADFNTEAQGHGDAVDAAPSPRGRGRSPRGPLSVDAAPSPRGRARRSATAAPLPIPDDEKPFALPAGWEWVRLGDVTEIIRGSGIQRNEITASGVHCVRYGELYTEYKNKVRIGAIKSFTSAEVAAKAKHVEKGDLLVTLTGENHEEIGMTVAYMGNDEVVAGGDLAIVRQKEIDPVYLSYFMSSPLAIEQKSNASKGDIIVHLSAKSLTALVLPLPPLAEQKRIVAKIEELMPLVAKLKT